MKNLLLGLALLMTSFSFGQWNHVGVGTNLPTNIEAISEELLIGVGPNYEVQRSTDGGVTWESSMTDYEYSFLSDIDFVDDQIGYICGGTWFGWYRCCLLKTIDAGLTWDTISANHHSSYMHYKLSFPTENLGFLTLEGGGLLKTEDGGESFTEIEFGESDAAYSMYDVEFLDENIGYASYNGYVFGELVDVHTNRMYKTIDQGETWTVVYESVIEIEDFTEAQTIMTIDILDADHIFCSGANGGFLKSEDAGETWEYSTIAPGSNDLIALDFVTPEIGFTNAAGIMHRTEDGGETWSPQTTNPLSFVDDITMVTEEIGYFVGPAQWGTRYVQKTTNAGGPLSINEYSQGNLSIYPNPTNESFSIQNFDNIPFEKMELLDLSGRIVKTFDPRETNYRVDGIEYGNYIVVVYQEKNTYSLPIIIQ